MTGSVDADIRADEAVVADCDFSFVEDCEVEVGEEAFANGYLFAVIAVERLIDDDFGSVAKVCV